MDKKKAYFQKSFMVIISFMAVIGCLASAGLYKGGQWLIAYSISAGENQLITKNIDLGLFVVKELLTNFYTLVLPSLLAVFIVLGFLTWLVLRISMGSVFKDIEPDEKTVAPKKGGKDFIDQRIAQDRKRRLFLHTLSVLQRDGRLLDFFDEDLNAYEDEQIGAAVRSIQEDCKKAVKKYIDPRPIIAKEEGARVTIEAGFDLDSIKLIGNVTGEPPFEGNLKHPGWKAGKKEIPKLSDIQDSCVIIPAEVEIN
ncbi:MAG: DUF2760 domain-containing protein [Desulfobacteraceae bacterium]|nr:DUF2760 domain-containing protein [Desulfobacteraceae bacterium]